MVLCHVFVGGGVRRMGLGTGGDGGDGMRRVVLCHVGVGVG